MKRTPFSRAKPFDRKRPMRRRRRSTKYSRRPRDFEFMGWVKTLLCSVEEERPDPDREPTPCHGVIEADHMGPRGISQKADDRTCAPMCHGHHGERTDHTGSFKYLKQADLRGWRDRAMARTQALWAERTGQIVPASAPPDATSTRAREDHR